MSLYSIYAHLLKKEGFSSVSALIFLRGAYHCPVRRIAICNNKLHDNYPKKSNRLLRQTVGYIFICAICLGFFFAPFEFYSIQKQEIKRLNDNLDQIEQTQVETLTNNAWVLNSESIQIQLQSLVQHPNIMYLEFSDVYNRNKIIAGEKPVSLDGLVSRVIPIRFVV